MDRYLVSGALTLLIFQIAWLLSSLGLIDSLHFKTEGASNNKQIIGHMIQKRENVKRKGADSIIWEDSNPNDTLYRYDSVLTLDNSTAQLNLEGDVKLQIHENTLVMLEPIEQNSEDSLRVRFYKGQLRSRNSGQRLSVGSGEWTVEAKPGTDLSLRALEGERVELEINKGEVHLENKVSGETKVIENGKKLTLSQESIETVQSVSPELKIETPHESRIYSHTFPLQVAVTWKGPARFLRLIKPNHEEIRQPVSLSDPADKPPVAFLQLDPGTYSLALEDERGFVSSSSTLEIVPAPKIRYLNPLPRDRINLETNYLFSWYPAENVDRYEVRINNDHDEPLKKESALPYANVQAPHSGEFSWSIYAYDSDGFVIPPFYSLPVYFTPNPLAAPRLNLPMAEPEPRAPAQESDEENKQKAERPHRPDGAQIDYKNIKYKNLEGHLTPTLLTRFIAKVFELLIPNAQAEVRKQASFSWFSVEGADFYTIEISSKADFLKPEVIKKVKRPEFVWTDFKEEVYYWRVAAGTKDGRMGLFSEAAKFDIKTLIEKPAGSLGPSLQYVEKPVAKPALPVAVTPSPLPPTAVISPAAVAPTASTPTEPTEPAEPTFFDVAANFDYWLITQKNAAVEQVQFRGMAIPSFTFAKSWNINRKNYVTKLGWHSLTWQPENLPYQEEFDTQMIDFRIYREVEDWSFGFALKQFPFIERKAAEQVEPKETILYGALLNYQNSLTPKTYWQSQFTHLYGDNNIQAGLENKINFFLQDHVDQPGRKGFYHGGLLDLFGTTGDDSYSSLFFRIGYELGYRW